MSAVKSKSSRTPRSTLESSCFTGIYGPLIVLPPGEKCDPSSDLSFIFSVGDFGRLQELALINGTPQSKAFELPAAKRYRFRLINISTSNQGMQVSLPDAKGPVEWQVIAKDGADLPVEAIHSSKAQLTITVGETYDVEFYTPSAQDLVLDLLLPGQKIHTSQTLAFTQPVQSKARNKPFFGPNQDNQHPDLHNPQSHCPHPW